MSQTPSEFANAHVSPADLDTNERNALLSNAHRRAVLRVLAKRAGAVTLESLAESVAAHDAEVSSDSLAVRLHHIHLPKLDEAGVLEYDPESNRVVSHGVTTDLLA